MTSDLTYNIASHKLTGRIGTRFFDASAGSGGRAGSTTKGAVNPFLANNPLAYCVKSPKTGQFGPLPLGLYSMKSHESHKGWIRLIPNSSNQMCGRDGFAIHGHGRIGSHGCIVPESALVLNELLQAVAGVEKAKGTPPTLEVVAIGSDLDRQNRMA